MAIKVKKWDREIRGVTYTGTGQRLEMWLPEGTYTPGNVVKLYAGRDGGEMFDARELIRHNGEKWYIGEAVFQTL